MGEKRKEKWLKCRGTIGKMLLCTTQKSGKFFCGVGLIEIIPTRKTYGSLSGFRERRVLDLKSLGLNVGGN